MLSLSFCLKDFNISSSSKVLVMNSFSFCMSEEKSLFFFWLSFLNVYFILFFIFIYLFLAVLGLYFCARAFSSCGKRGPLFIAVCGPLTVAASPVAEHRLQMRRLSSCGSRV